MMQNKEQFVIRDAERADCHAIHSLILEQAEFHKMLDQVVITVQQLEQDGFSTTQRPKFQVILVENISNISEPNIVGFLIYLETYCSFQGPFLWMEDLYIKEKYRGFGLGRALISSIIRKAKQKKMPKIEWIVLGWNKAAIEFYRNKLLASDLTEKDDYHVYCLKRDAFAELANFNLENVQHE